ncbi:MAG: choice-of-anchor J domain-containing protein, partial [Planctomycetota bacterium]
MRNADVDALLNGGGFNATFAVDGGFVSAVVLPRPENTTLTAGRENSIASARYRVLEDVGDRGTKIELVNRSLTADQGREVPIVLTVDGRTRYPERISHAVIRRRPRAPYPSLGHVLAVGLDFGPIVSNAVADSALLTDKDGDGMSGLFEIEHGLNPRDPSDGEADADGDGVSNRRESELGSDPQSEDTDGDGLGDGAEVLAGLDPASSDTDGDGVGDAEDPFGSFAVQARLVLPGAGVVDADVPITVRLESPSGELLDEADSRFSLEIDGEAEFSSVATTGRVISGGGTSRVTVEASGGLVELSLRPRSEGTLRLSVLDTGGVGMELVQFASVFDFEADDGGFTHAGTSDAWQWGEPRFGPDAAVSGLRVWGTQLDGDAPERSNSWLVTPPIAIASGSTPYFSFEHYLDSEECDVRGLVEVTTDGENYRPLPGVRVSAGGSGEFRCRETEQNWERIDVSLADYVGQTVQIRFHFYSDTTVSGPGWLIDDVSFTGLGRPGLRVYDRDGDEDLDGVSNGDELENGTNPARADSDDDGLSDRVETGTGVFVDADDTGTDPLDADTDDGGVPDGREVDRGRNPLNPDDDVFVEVLAWVTHTNRFREYERTVEAIRSVFPDFSLSEIDSESLEQLRDRLAGVDLLLLPEQTNQFNAVALGTTMSTVLREFVHDGGVVVALARESVEMLRGAGLVTMSQTNVVGDDLRVDRSLHPVVEGIEKPLRVSRDVT